MTDLNITATSYALLQGKFTCWKCSESIVVTAIWVPGFLDNEDEEYPEEGGPSLLKYVSELDVGTMARVRAAAPWLKPNCSQTASMGVRARQAPGQDFLTTRATYRTEGGVRLAAEHTDGDLRSTRATADAMTRYGDARIMLDRYDGQTQVAANFSGAVFLDHRGVAFGRPAYASFAVVDVPGQAGLPVRVNGAPVGITNRQGRVLVTNVPSLLPTTFSLKDKDLPVGVEIGETEKQSVAPRQGGVRVTFPVLTQNARAFTVTGASIAPGTLASTPNEQAMVGYDGALYLERPEPGMAVEVSGVCKAVLPSPLPGVDEVAKLRCN